MKMQFSEKAFEQFCYWEEQNKAVFKKLKSLLRDISRDPFTGLGKSEPLKDNLTGYWSRRITDEHRIVYRIDGDVLYIESCKGHYED